jgi:hypothetical protein
MPKNHARLAELRIYAQHQNDTQKYFPNRLLHSNTADKAKSFSLIIRHGGYLQAGNKYGKVNS